MDYLHPTMQQALAGIVPPGFRSAPVMHATQHLRAALASFDAPRCPAGQFLHVHLHKKLGALDCHLQWEDAEPEAGWAEQVTLCAAYLRGVDILYLLPAADVEAIEIEATRQPRQFLEPV